jgi:dTDP-glucose pyrophosphorylase
MDINNFIINIKSTLVDVLKKIDETGSLQTVFVVNDENKLLGTITDGDIRRAFINGLTLDNPIIDFICKDFSYLESNTKDFEKLKEFRVEKIKAVPVLSDRGEILKIIDFTIMKSLLPIDAVIMAGGLGTRLKPLTDNTPKPLVKVGNKEIISYNFDRLYQYGIFNQYVTVNYLGNQIEDFCIDYNDEINFKIIKEDQFLGTAGALSLIDDFENDTVLLMNSDLLTNIDYEDFYRSFKENNADIMVASIPYDVSLPYAIFKTKSNNRHIKSFSEKPTYTHYANTGIYMMKKSVLKHIPKNEFFNATDLMNAVINEKGKLIHFPITGYWLDIGKHKDLEKAQRDISHIDFD